MLFIENSTRWETVMGMSDAIRKCILLMDFLRWDSITLISPRRFHDGVVVWTVQRFGIRQQLVSRRSLVSG